MPDIATRERSRGSPLHIAILVVGTLGDVRPLLALGGGLRRLGHEVTVATHELYEEEVRSRGMDFRCITVNPRAVMETSDGLDWLRSQSNPVKTVRAMAAMLRPVLRQIFDDSWQACKEADALICSALCVHGWDIAERLGVPCVFTPLFPLRRSRSFAAVHAPQLPLGPVYNLLTHLASQQISWQPFRDITNLWRSEVLGLPPEPVWGARRLMGWPDVPVVSGFSQAVLPKPRDWPANHHITGYWFDESPAAEPDAAVADFMDDGAPPVYVGFGSMADPEPEKLAEVIREALRRTGRRAVVATGWAKLPLETSDQILVVESVPHEWLFPRVAAAVHHGGCGTIGAALKAGVPSIVVPYFFDQPLWARRLARLGVAARPLPRSKLTAERLAAALGNVCDDPATRDRARAISHRVRCEDGVGSAVRLIDDHICASRGGERRSSATGSKSRS
jgi:UDP:flavonoid glycosyltransferase YjiC (YdhE family)